LSKPVLTGLILHHGQAGRAVRFNNIM